MKETAMAGVSLSLEGLPLGHVFSMDSLPVTCENLLRKSGVPQEEQGMAALTELFREVQNGDITKMVERIATDIDEIVRIVRFPGWQNTHKGQREVKVALRQTLARYQLHTDNDLFDRAYGYIAAYY